MPRPHIVETTASMNLMPVGTNEPGRSTPPSEGLTREGVDSDGVDEVRRDLAGAE
jgi:hypothetical protein